MDLKLTDVGAERAVLASIFTYGLEAYVEVCDIIQYNTFGHQNNQLIYKCIQKVMEGGLNLDLPSFLSAAQQLHLSDVINTEQELEYVKSLMSFPVDKGNITHFAVQVKKFEYARQMHKMTLAINREIEGIDGDESIDDIVGILENPVMEFLREDATGNNPEQLGEGIDEYIEYLLENQCDQIGIDTGFSEFDTAIGGGARRKCVDLVSARPKVGKSVFGDNVAIHVSGSGIPTLMLDTEMSKEDHLNRIISNLSGVPIKEIETGSFVEDEIKYKSVLEAAKKIKEMPYTYACVSGVPFENIVNTIKRWVMSEVGVDENGRTNDCVVIYDYLKLMSSGSITNNIQEYQALGFQITALHNLAVKYDFPCIAFVQLNRDGITKESTDAVSGSDRLIWLCTSFSIFKEKSIEEIAEDGKEAGNRKLVPIVCRHGPGMEDGNYINMNMIGSHADLKELHTRDGLNSGLDNDLEGIDLLEDYDDDE